MMSKQQALITPYVWGVCLKMEPTRFFLSALVFEVSAV